MRSRFSDQLKFRLIVTIVLLSLGGCGSKSDPVLEETFEQLYAVEPTIDVTIQNGDGAILIYGSNVSEMRVHAVKKAYSRSRLTQIGINVSASSRSVSITTKFPAKPKWGLSDRSGTVDYTIVVPGTANISGVTLDAGEILLDGMRGQATRARLGDGRLFVRNCFAGFDVAVRRGNLIVSYDWWEQSNFSAHGNIAQGNAWAFFPPDAALNLVAHAVHGKIGSDFESAAVTTSTFAVGTKMNAPVNGGSDATIKLHVVEGNIKIVEATP